MLKELEDWWEGKDLPKTEENILKNKGRWTKIEIGTKFGATCWEVILGNVQVEPKQDWYRPCEMQNLNGSCVIAREVSFVTPGDSQFKNIVFADEKKQMKEWPGLEKTIKVALDKAYELGL